MEGTGATGALKSIVVRKRRGTKSACATCSWPCRLSHKAAPPAPHATAPASPYLPNRKPDAPLSPPPCPRPEPPPPEDAHRLNGGLQNGSCRPCHPPFNGWCGRCSTQRTAAALTATTRIGSASAVSYSRVVARVRPRSMNHAGEFVGTEISRYLDIDVCARSFMHEQCRGKMRGVLR